MKKVLVILGQTATGKSSLAVNLAKKFNGEVISADSRQVYKGLDIGTGKITKKEMKGVTHHLLDVASPKTVFNVAKWKTLTEKKIEEMTKRGKLPIICGGTGFYIDSIVSGIVLPEVKANKKLRNDLGKKTEDQLLNILKKLDEKRAENIDPKNKVRLIRAIEIATKLGVVPEIKIERNYDVLEIGLRLPDVELRKKISIRLFARIRAGMTLEAKRLHKKGLSYKRMRELGLEYRYLADYLENKINKTELTEKLNAEIWQFSKRQMTWFKKDKNIIWFNPKEEKEINNKIKNFLDS
jgi:tRNA dimethylallyltransferase